MIGARLILRAVDAGLAVEVFTNLLHIKDSWWDLFASPKISLATSYYSDTASDHEQVTGRRGSHARTRANIAEAVRRDIPLRVGIINVLDGQRVEQARAELEALGVSGVGTGRLRGVGRGARTLETSLDVSQLCGRCGHGMAAISPDGDVWPCVLSRWMHAGNVKEQSLAGILTGRRMRDMVAAISSHPAINPCNPDKAGCKPKLEGGDCHPAEKPACKPKYK